MENKGIEIKAALMERGLKQEWLIKQILKFGIPISKAELSDIIHGRRVTEKAQRVLDTARILIKYHDSIFSAENIKNSV